MLQGDGVALLRHYGTDLDVGICDPYGPELCVDQRSRSFTKRPSPRNESWRAVAASPR